MPTNKHFAIDPLGGKHTRNSQSRKYTHTVLVLATYEGALATAKRNHEEAIATYRRNFQYYVEIITNDPHPEVDYTYPNGPGFGNAVKVVNAERQAARIAKHKALVDAGVEAYIANKLADAIARVEANNAAGHYQTNGKPGRYSSVGWCGRADLAAKLQAQWTGSIVVEAQM